MKKQITQETLTEEQLIEETFTEDHLSAALKNSSEKAQELLEDEDKMERFLERLERKIAKVPLAGKQLSYIPVLISLVRAYMKKEYTDIPIGTIIAIVGCLVYFLSPIDLVPDSIPVIGYVDDAAVFAFAWKMIGDDVQEYKDWKESNKIIV